jgi:CspA family cold shock protein
MNTMTKSLLISPVLGVIAFLIIGFIQKSTLRIPSTPADLAELVVLIAAVLAGCLVVARSGRHEYEDEEEETGTVKWFNVKKGYGFITRDHGDDVFVHYRNIVGEGRRAISEGQRVRFIVVDGDKGLQADEVQAI